ncbi:hypothetical protein AB6A40_004795 [Gnathostoma spinigerum]|uniref:Uncharacterized protein n=1 Tax=Gnathostoma spinigerum TaxID=75299 RepID=A0ABD6EKZ8_9BILA
MRIFFSKRILFIVLLLTSTAFTQPLRIESNGVDSVVLTGQEKPIIIDTSATFRVERLDAPIDRIEIRLIDENSTQPVVIDIQKAHSTTIAPPSSAESQANSVIEEGTNQNVADMVHSDIRKRIDDQQRKIGALEIKVERKVDVHLAPNTASQWNTEQGSQSTAEYVDDLPMLDIGDDSEEEIVEELPVERCYLNRALLPAGVVVDMNAEKRNLSRILKQYNTQLRSFCSPEREAKNEAFRNCPLWREEKMINYYKLMRLLYCSDYNLWPNAPKIKRSFGANLQLFEKLYAFMPKQ